MGLRCFTCKQKLRYKKDVWRDWNGYPNCIICIKEHIYEELWCQDDRDIDNMLSLIRADYNKSVQQYKRHEVEIRCPNKDCGCGIMYDGKGQDRTEFMHTCPQCHYVFYVDKNDDVTEFAKHEELLY